MQLKIDEAFAERVIPANDSVRLLDQTVDEMDLQPLWSTYKRLGRKPATNPVILFKVILYAYMEGIYSIRNIESACKRDINFIWLLNGAKAPNYHEIARFRSQRLSMCSETLFYTLVKLLGNKGEICYEHLFVDGTKIEANANKYSFVWKKSTTKYENRLLEKLNIICEELRKRYGLLSVEAEEVLLSLESLVKEPFVYGRGKRKSQLQRDIELLRALLKRRDKYAHYQRTFKGRNSFSKTDPDATFMRMKDDHMRNAQLKPGYNVQLGVEGEYITGISVSSERSDQLTLIPFMDNMEAHIGREYKDVTLDAGYESEENYTYFENKTTDCYIKPQNYERSKTRKYKSNMALRENMTYDSLLDEYTCHQGKKLRLQYEGIRRSKSGYESHVSYYECESCDGCPKKKQCTRSKGNRKLQVSKKFIEQRTASLSRITSEKGILLRMNRSIQSEGAFGVIKQNYAFRQFLLRGHKKVSTEIFLISMGYNINKLHAKIQQNRTGTQLFEKLTA
ncbi:MAG: IS1182 family transposase [Christensenellaceae bacterium]|nr:IS1182 family transposase [Christensenellaceae bacterium]